MPRASRRPTRTASPCSSAEVTFSGGCCAAHPCAAIRGRRAPDLLSDPGGHPQGRKLMTDTTHDAEPRDRRERQRRRPGGHADRHARSTSGARRRDPPAPERSRTRCPVIHGGQPHPTTGNANRVWWPEPAEPQDPGEEPRRWPTRSARTSTTRPAFESLDLAAVKAGHRRGPHHVAGLVARRLRQLRPAHHPHGVAQRRHLPRAPTAAAAARCRPAALRAAEQLAGQRQPRQGPPPAVAGQEEVRPVGSRGPTS